MNRMTEEAKRALILAYRAWRPESGVTIDELAQSHGVTKSALYAMLRREGEPLHTGRATNGIRSQEPLMEGMSRIALELILDQRDELRAEVARLRLLVKSLGGDPDPT